MPKIELTLRGQKVSGTVTDDDGLFFASLCYDQNEKDLTAQGLEQEAFVALSQRLGDSLNSAKEQEVNANIALKIRREIANNWDVRKIVCWRLIECFPKIDPELVYWESDRRFGIRLSLEELMLLLMNVIVEAFAELKASTPSVPGDTSSQALKQSPPVLASPLNPVEQGVVLPAPSPFFPPVPTVTSSPLVPDLIQEQLNALQK